MASHVIVVVFPSLTIVLSNGLTIVTPIEMKFEENSYYVNTYTFDNRHKHK